MSVEKGTESHRLTKQMLIAKIEEKDKLLNEAIENRATVIKHVKRRDIIIECLHRYIEEPF